MKTWVPPPASYKQIIITHVYDHIRQVVISWRDQAIGPQIWDIRETDGSAQGPESEVNGGSQDIKWWQWLVLLGLAQSRPPKEDVKTTGESGPFWLGQIISNFNIPSPGKSAECFSISSSGLFKFRHT